MSCSFIKAMRHSLSESSALHASPQPADMTDGRGIVRPGIPHALPLISSFNGAVVVSKVMISRFFFSLAKFLSITSHLVQLYGLTIRDAPAIFSAISYMLVTSPTASLSDSS